jgi:Predicted Zn peptidase
MPVTKKIRQKAGSFSKSRPYSRKVKFSSPIALGLCAAVPAATDPIDAILWHAGVLVIESGLTAPPFAPASYAPLRKVKEIIQKDLAVEGRLVPCYGGFTIELREDRSHERKNFTCAHELAHTFFYEAIPSIKYRTHANSQYHHDEEEEMLCNVAAGELLMPSTIFTKIAKDFSPSPQSLQQLAQMFETSLTATIVHLLKLQIWDSTFILWKYKDEGLTAEWIARPGFGLTYHPILKVNNIESSSIYHTFLTGEPMASAEWLSLNGGFKAFQVKSMRLNSAKTVLTSICTHSLIRTCNSHIQIDAAPSLPLNYTCECYGTGWCSIKKDGVAYATRCRASQHNKG